MKEKTSIRNAGFTLIEILVVLALIAVVGLVTLPGIRQWQEDFRLRGAASSLYADMTTARVRTIKDKMSHILQMDGANARWVIYHVGPNGADDNQTSDDVLVLTRPFSEFGITLTTGRGSAPGSADGDVLSANSTTFAGDKVRFNTMGALTANDPGFFHLSNDQNSAFAIGSLASGVIRTLRWDGGAWK